MGSKNKLQRFRENEIFPNVIQPTRQQVLDGFSLKGRWHTFFKNKNPIVLELGCGKGEYSLSIARRNPEVNCIGIDIKGARFWRGAKTALEENIVNVAFLRTQIELIDQCFAPDEISEIWITFPDPQIKYRRTKHRLTHPDFLNKYKHILKKDGSIHLKTDSEFMYAYTLGLLQGLEHEICYAHHDVYNSLEAPALATEVQTFYEQKFLEEGKSITYLQFKLND